ncbi:MAG: SAM-dependent methyltransferase, partial [Planctomycetota bacterium]
MSLGIALAENGLVGDGLIRRGINRLLDRRLERERSAAAAPDYAESVQAWLGSAPVAVRQEAANDQHYEVPAQFYQLCLGRHLKYSCCWWDADTAVLDQAEAAMLERTCERAGLADGQRILEIGCGWGSLTMWMAARYPQARIRAVSNSHSQGAWIREQCARRGLDNVVVDTADISDYQPPERYDRIVSVECFEHLRNYRELFRRLRGWLQDAGQCFVHVFCHRSYTYPFEEDGAANWMGRHFFSGGIMPGFDLFRRFDEDLVVARDWRVPGTHYARTASAWLERLDRHRREAAAVLAPQYGAAGARRQVRRWRLFFLACEELWKRDQGREWLVGHYLLRPRVAGR